MLVSRLRRNAATELVRLSNDSHLEHDRENSQAFRRRTASKQRRDQRAGAAWICGALWRGACATLRRPLSKRAATRSRPIAKTYQAGRTT